MQFTIKKLSSGFEFKVYTKLIERIVVVQLQNHLLQNSILEQFQSVYRCVHSTETTS